MQDKYVGDVGDYGKYGLLSQIWIESGRRIKLGVNWFYVTRPEIKKHDGRYIDYLKKPNCEKFRPYFPELFDELRTIVYEKRRNLREIENSAVALPRGSRVYSEPVPYKALSLDQRAVNRETWFQNSLQELAKCDLIFLDPDNGIQTNKVRKTQGDATKYVFEDEIKRYYESGKSLIIYNHKGRIREREYKKKFRTISRCIKSPNELRVLRFNRFSVRYYVFVTQPRHVPLINETITNLTKNDFLFRQVSC